VDGIIQAFEKVWDQRAELRKFEKA